MPVTIDQLTEGYWWDQFHGDLRIIELRRHSFDTEKWFFKAVGQAEEDFLSSIDLASLVAPVAPYREKNTLVVIGCLGLRRAYVNVPRERAIERYLKTEDQDQLGSYEKVDEHEFVDELWAYDVSGPL